MSTTTLPVLFLVKVDGQWTVGTRDGHLVTCRPDQTMPGAPMITVGPRCSVPTIDALARTCPHCDTPRVNHQDTEHEDAHA